jgi:hypothetical protein
MVVVRLVACLLEVAEDRCDIKQGSALQALRDWVQIGARLGSLATCDLCANSLNAVVSKQPCDLQLVFVTPVGKELLRRCSCKPGSTGVVAGWCGVGVAGLVVVGWV